MNVLTNEQRSAFDEDGFVVLRGLLDAWEAEVDADAETVAGGFR